MYVKRKEIIFIGDFNMDMLIGQNNPQRPNQDLSNFIEQLCLTNLITNPTRVTKSTKSLLDVILVSHPDRFVTSGNLHLGISDHDLIYVVRKQKLPKTKAKSIEFRSIKNLNHAAFKTDLGTIPWDSSYIFENVDDVWHHWASLYSSVLDKHAPVQKICLRTNQLPWTNPNIQKQMCLRNRLYKKFRRFSTEANWLNYKVQHNKVTSLKRDIHIVSFCRPILGKNETSATDQQI
jgi:hypothetical protein